MLDGERIARYFLLNEYELTHDPVSADIIIANTCAFEKISEFESLRKIEYFTSIKKKKTKVIVCGCLPAISRKKLEKIFSGDSFIPKSKDTWKSLDDIINAKVSISTVKDPCTISSRWKDWKLIGRYEAVRGSGTGEKITGYDDSVYHLRVATGCTGKCSYCGIRFARGKITSRSITDILEAFKKGLDQGYKSFKIWADDIGAYGIDRGTDLAEMLSAILKSPDDFELEILSSNPKNFIEMFDKLSICFTDKRIKYFNISIQSASPSVLKRMNRSVDLKRLETILKILKKSFKHITIRTHYLVGFPGETWPDLLKTLLFTLRVRNFKYLIFIFDPKENTEASYMNGQIPEKTKQLRSDILRRWGQFWSFILEDGRTY